MAELKLYMTSTCPYCKKVLNFMKQNNISIPPWQIEISPLKIYKPCSISVVKHRYRVLL